MSRFAAVLRGVLALLLLAVLVVGVPLALWRLVGWPLPHAIPSFQELKDGLTAHGVPDEVLFKILACVCWIAWIGLVASVASEAVAVAKGRAARRIPVLGFLQPLAANLVAALTVAVLVASSRPHPTEAVPLSSALARYHPAVAPVSVAANGHSARGDGLRAAKERGAPRTYVVARHDTLWGIAERELGDPFRWREIYRLNEGRRQPDGRSLSDPNRIAPGWSLRLPSAAATGGQKSAGTNAPRPADRHAGPAASGTCRVREGDSLWAIAERELGDAHRWREIFELNRGRVFEGGERLKDPDLIRTGWMLRLPAVSNAPSRPDHHAAHHNHRPRTAGPTPEPRPSHTGPNGKPSPNRHPSPTPKSTSVDQPEEPPARPTPPSVGLPAGALIAGSTAAALLAAAAIGARRRRARRLDFFTSTGDMPPPAEAFVALLRHRLRGAEGDRVTVAVDRFARAWETAGLEPPRIVGCVEDAEQLKFLVRSVGVALDRVGPGLADTLGCSVEVRDLDETTLAVGLTGFDVGSMSFLPGVRPRFPLLIPLGKIGSSVLHVNLAAVPITITGPEADLVAFSLCIAAAAKASPRHLQIAVDRAAAPPLRHLRDLPHAASWDEDDGEIGPEVERRRVLARSEGVRSFEELSAIAGDVTPPRVLAVTARVGVDSEDAGVHGVHFLRTGSDAAATHGAAVRAEDGSLFLSAALAEALGLGSREVTLAPFRLTAEQAEAGMQVLSDAFAPTEAVAPDVPASREEVQRTPVFVTPTREEIVEPEPLQEKPLELSPDQRPEPDRPVEVRCLGTLRVTVDGRQVSRGRAKSFELLARLALHPGEPVGRERIAEDLWPETDPEVQNERIWDAVSGLRQMLRSGPDDSREFLKREPPSYRLNDELVWVDVSEFKRAVEAGRKEAGPAGVEALRRGVELYRGDLLQDRYYEWAEPESRRLRDQYLGALLLLAERLTEEGDFVGALDAANRGLTLEPLSEAFHARAMRIYAAQDRRDALVAQYREAAKRWEADGFDSPEELRVLAGHLLGQTSLGGALERKDGKAPRERPVVNR
jgi:DNA-binding SARP family transcriptional activator/nucleoid-associated protein YgaU